MVFSARKLLQYFQLLDKNYRHISRYIYNFFLYFKIVNSNISLGTPNDVLGNPV
jgi:hypothetical protein